MRFNVLRHVSPDAIDTQSVQTGSDGARVESVSRSVRVTVGKATQRPEVRSHPATDGDFVTISLSDTGRGIPPDDLIRIFEPIFTTKGVGEGNL